MFIITVDTDTIEIFSYVIFIFLRHIYLLITCRFTVNTDTMEIIIFLRHIYFLTPYLSIDCMSVFFLLENSSIMYVESLILLEEGCKVKAVLGVYNSGEAVPSFFQSHPKTTLFIHLPITASKRYRGFIQTRIFTESCAYCNVNINC